MPRRELPPLPKELTDRDEIGMSTMLGFSLPMLSLLLQCIAEAGDSRSILNVTAPNGARVGASHFADQDWFTLFADHGEDVPEPYADARDEALRDHGYEHRASARGYVQEFTFETDDAFLYAARIMVGTLQHAYRCDRRDRLAVLLDLAR